MQIRVSVELQAKNRMLMYNGKALKKSQSLSITNTDLSLIVWFSLEPVQSRGSLSVIFPQLAGSLYCISLVHSMRKRDPFALLFGLSNRFGFVAQVKTCSVEEGFFINKPCF
jgi:hypothetical protein